MEVGGQLTGINAFQIRSWVLKMQDLTLTDNALLADMTVSDRHFLPHRAKLNHLGVQRLSRLASLMDAYGGVVRFNSELDDEELIAQRTEAIVEFLAEAGVDTTREVLVEDMPGGRYGRREGHPILPIFGGDHTP